MTTFTVNATTRSHIYEPALGSVINRTETFSFFEIGDYTATQNAISYIAKRLAGRDNPTIELTVDIRSERLYTEMYNVVTMSDDGKAMTITHVYEADTTLGSPSIYETTQKKAAKQAIENIVTRYGIIVQDPALQTA
ncbi:MAG: hypothetical protein IJK28_12315 [Clostridia bacterium]|nr:hypothetical protein [Clostridia bacterium]